MTQFLNNLLKTELLFKTYLLSQTEFSPETAIWKLRLPGVLFVLCITKELDVSFHGSVLKEGLRELSRLLWNKGEHL